MGKGEKKRGIAAAIAATGPGSPPAPGEVMGDLFGAPIQAPRHKAAELEAERRGPGRPKGKANRRSKEWIDYLSSRYSMPLERLVALQAMTPLELFRDLRVQASELLNDVNGGFVGPARFAPMTEVEAMGLLIGLMGVQNAAAKEALPYLHEKRGAVVQDDQGNDVPVLAFVTPSGALAGDQAASAAFGMDLRPRNLRSQGNQALIEGDAGKSTEEKSTDNAKSLKDNTETPE